VAQLPRQLVVGVATRRARGAEHADGALDLLQGAKAPRELRGDVAHAVGVGCADLRRLPVEPQQQLLVEGRFVPFRAAAVGGHGAAEYGRPPAALMLSASAPPGA